MQSIREHFTTCKIPEDIPMCSCTLGDQALKLYDVYIKKWTTFCLQQKINSWEPNVNDVFTFLHEFPKRKLSYSAINPDHSALSSYFMVFQFHGTLYTVSTHPFVIQYLTGVLNCRKPTSRSQHTWDVTLVFSYIQALLYPLQTLCLKDLTFELVILLALTSGQRCQTLTFMNTTSMTKTQDNFLFSYFGTNKTRHARDSFNSFLVRIYPQQPLVFTQHLNIISRAQLNFQPRTQALYLRPALWQIPWLELVT